MKKRNHVAGVMAAAGVTAAIAYSYKMMNMPVPSQEEAKAYSESLLARMGIPELVDTWSEEELEVVVFILLAARSYLALRYVDGTQQKNTLPEWVAKTYMKFVRYGLEGVPPPSQASIPANKMKTKKKAKLSA